MSLLDFINYYAVPGIVLGSIYALGAIGITLVFAILRYANLAHGDMVTLGAFLALLATTTFGLPLLAALPLAMIATAAAATGIDQLFYSHLRSRPKIVTVIASLGVALMIRSFIQFVWGTDTATFSGGINPTRDYFGLLVRGREVVTVLALALLVAGLQFFLTKFRWGKALRAMSSNPDLALLSGIDNRKMVMLTWIIAGALCSVAGFFQGLNFELKSMMGWQMLLPMFAAAILGGVGRIEGAVLGGLLVGLVEEISVLIVPSEYKSATAFTLLLAILIFRPTGILRGKVLEGGS